MRVLVISPFQPHPEAGHGGGAYLGLVVRALAAHAEVAVASYSFDDDRPPLEGVRHFSTRGQRHQDLGGLARRLDSVRNLWRWAVRRTPLEAAKQQSPAFRSLVRRAITGFQPDIVLVEFMVMAWCLADLADCKTVLTDHERGVSVPARLGPGGFGRTRDRALWRRYVARYYPMADLVQALTTEDAASLAEQSGCAVEVRPPLIELPTDAAKPGTSAPVMLFFGDYRHRPNPESARFLAQAVLPRVRQRVPNAELWLAGANAPPGLEALGEQAGVRCLGFVDDLEAVIAAARCFTAPVFSGHGFRTKTLHALAHGLPVVANGLGLQGLDAPTAAVRCGESADELATAALAFLEDPDAAQTAGTAGREWAAATFKAEVLAAQQLSRFAQLLGPARS